MLRVEGFSFLGSFFGAICRVIGLFVSAVGRTLSTRFVFRQRPMIFYHVLRAQRMCQARVRIRRRCFYLCLNYGVRARFANDRQVVKGISQCRRLLAVLFFHFFLVSRVFNRPHEAFGSFRYPKRVAFTSTCSRTQEGSELGRISVVSTDLGSFVFGCVL